MNLQQASVCSANLNMLLGLFRGLVTYKRTMDKIEMFLKYPSLFVDTNLAARQIGSPHPRGNGPRIDGTASSEVDGLLFISGLPRRLDSESFYGAGTICGLESLPEVTVSEEGRYDIKYKTQKIIYENNSYTIGGRNYQYFSRIMFQDIKTTAFVDNLPGATEIMQRCATPDFCPCIDLSTCSRTSKFGEGSPLEIDARRSYLL